MFDFERNQLHYIKGGRYPHCHTLFINDRITTLIDPACEERFLKPFLNDKSIDVIVNSHCHEDHFLNNYLFPDAELWVHSTEAHMFTNMEDLLDAWMSAEEKATSLGEEARRFLINDAHYVAREPDRLLEDEEMVILGDTRMQVLHMPGHSPGHLCFFFPDDRVLYTADLDLVKAGPYYGDIGSSIEATIRSLERMMQIDVDFYLSAHGKQGIYEGDPDTVKQYMNIIFDRENRLLEILAEKPRTLDEISKIGIIYGKRDSSDIWFIAASETKMMEKHLERLEMNSRIQKDGEYYLI